MKFFLAALCVILPMTSFANTINFHCISADVKGIHKFDASGVVTIDDSNIVHGIINVSTQKADVIQSIQTYENVLVEGHVKYFGAGALTKNPFQQLILKTNEVYLKSLNLLLDFDGKISSRVLSVDNFSYRSNCKVTTEN